MRLRFAATLVVLALGIVTLVLVVRPPGPPVSDLREAYPGPPPDPVHRWHPSRQYLQLDPGSLGDQRKPAGIFLSTEDTAPAEGQASMTIRPCGHDHRGGASEREGSFDGSDQVP
jgi:hypothetical protein